MKTRIAAGIVGIAVLLALILFVPPLVSKWMSAKKEAEVSKGQAGAAIDSGAVATNTLSGIITNDTATDETVQGGYDEIRNASEADRGDAALRASCRLRAYRNSERCAALRKADSGESDPAR